MLFACGSEIGRAKVGREEEALLPRLMGRVNDAWPAVGEMTG